MMKVGSQSQIENDNGWVYGTITTTGEVTAAGRVASCMGCHTQSEHDRLFGVTDPQVHRTLMNYWSFPHEDINEYQLDVPSGQLRLIQQAH